MEVAAKNPAISAIASEPGPTPYRPRRPLHQVTRARYLRAETSSFRERVGMGTTNSSEAMAELHLQERKLRTQRDELIDDLRAVGESWHSLASRTRLSRRALIKRRGDVTGLS